MSNNKISQIKLPNNNEIYDIEGRNIQRISWNDYSNLSEEDKKSNTAYYITNIPLDEGGYKHAEGSVISIDDGKLNEPLKACTVDINPVQSGSGTPSPSNIRPISGRTEANITVADAAVNPTVSNTYNIEFEDSGSPLTVYGGTLDVTSGVLTVDRAFVEFDGSSDELWMMGSASGHDRAYIKIDDIESYAGAYSSISQLYVCSIFDNGSWNSVFTGSPIAGMTGQNWGFGLDSFSITTDTELREWLSTNNIQIAYKLATPLTIQLTPTEITTLYGNNVIWADSGDMAITYTYESNNQIRMGDEIFSVGSNAQTISGHTVLTDVPADAVFTDTTYSVTPVTISTAQKGSDITVDDITAWNAGSVTTVTYNETTHSIIINNGVLPSLSYTAKNVPNITTENIQVVKDVSVVNSNITDG